MMTVLTANSGINLKIDQKAEPMEDRLREILKETKPCTTLKRPAEQKGKRSSKQEDGSNLQAHSPPKAASKKNPKEPERNTRSKKAAATPPLPKMPPAPKRAAQLSSGAAPKRTDATLAAISHRSIKDASLQKHASAPSALPAPQQLGEVQQLRGLPTGTAPATPGAQRVPGGQPQLASTASSPAAPLQQNQELCANLLSKWAGPGFSLPPTPEALPMPSANLLACKKKGSS
ncbi:hypothetical protein WJX75_000864 [Coccomyxa subellipsoidea]|uniref:Uncharacterized protein n=1 Tax=Coccomyxa subellipsoidea TaxID=248742 RepID=A0ABR2YBZ0_9CHLO